jgi:hypothetical protein
MHTHAYFSGSFIPVGHLFPTVDISASQYREGAFTKS